MRRTWEEAMPTDPEDACRHQQLQSGAAPYDAGGRCGVEAEALSPEARSELQKKVDAYDAMMTARIAAGRHVSVDRVRSDFGQGRVVLAQDALARRMVDRIGTLVETLDRIASVAPRPGVSVSVVGDDLDRRRRRFALQQLEHVARTPLVDIKDLDRRRRRHRLAEATRR
jgi:ClpP class serine protease